ncbi:sensor histidine kinase KdpD [Nocardia sp. BMG51109]|uniref:sensor histidine kinase n=1 Tax=Nocardia sp. BMG51109 TaxID=1056816 RepID=UPI001E41D842|nr:ATP-binding protein [Nocardia sp. BMG51109]
MNSTSVEPGDFADGENEAGPEAGHEGRENRATYSALVICAVVTGCAAVAAILAAPADFRIPLACGAALVAILLCATVTIAVHYYAQAGRYRRVAERADERIAAAAAAASARVAAAEGEATVRAREVRHSESRRAAALAAFAGAAGRMQAMTTSMLAELREMEHRHADPEVLADLLQLDHRTAQAGRLADSIAVLSGARSGRRWAKPIAMESILRGAMGRVAGYQRIRLRSVAGVGVAGHAAEGVMHALAELLDNACNFSPPTTEVHVYAAEVPAGVVVTLEDSGLVMSESALRKAERAVSGADAEGRGGVDLSSLSGTRLGLSVVGHLARKHGLTVSYRPSAIGGTAVVVIVPRDLITRMERTAVTGTPTAVPRNDSRQQLSGSPAGDGELADGAPRRATPEVALAQNSTFAQNSKENSKESTSSEDAPAAAGPRLPKRRRGDTLAAVHPDGLSNPNGPAARTEPPPPAKSSALGAFQRAMSGRDTVAETPSGTVENDR